MGFRRRPEKSQLSSRFFRAARHDVVASTRQAEFDPDYAPSCYTGTQAGSLTSLRPIHSGLVFDEASAFPDCHTTITPAEKAMLEGKYLEDRGDETEKAYQKTRYRYPHKTP